MEPFTPRQILVGTDFSELSTVALRHAGLWAQRFGASLIVMHAQEFPPVGGDPHFGSYDLTPLIEATRRGAEEQLAEHVRRDVPSGVPVTCETVAGSPAAMIEACAEARGADLVVLGTHGRGGVSRFLLGSVAERTLRLARRPTLIVRQTEGGEDAKPPAPSLRHVLCPVNHTEVARAAFEHARSVARAFDACLTVVFAVEPGEGELTAADLRRAEEDLQSWLSEKPPLDCQMQPVIRHGDPAQQVIGLAREAAVDLVVIGAQHRRFFDDTVLGVTTVRVTRHAPCPVLVAPRSHDA